MNTEKKDIPDSLLNSLIFLQKIARNISFVQYALIILMVFGGSWGLLFILDRFFETAAWIRLLLLGLSCLVAIYFAYQLFLKAFILPKSYTWIALKIKDVFGGPGDRFLGIIELTNTSEIEQKYSQTLFIAAQEKVIEEIEKLPLEKTFPRKTLNQIITGFTSSLLLIGICFFSFPDLTINSFKRWLMPWADIKRATLVNFEDIEDVVTLPRGEITNFTIQLKKESKLKPKIARIQGEGELSLEAERKNDFFRFIMPGLLKNRTLDIGVGDFKKKILFQPVNRPRIKSITSRIIFPDYLNLSPISREPLNDSLTFPVGSIIHLKGTSSRDLSSIKTVVLKEEIPTSFSGNSFSLKTASLQNNSSLMFEFKDIYNLTPRIPKKIQLLPVLDLPPILELPNSPAKIDILINETITIRATIKDDYGFSRFQLCMKNQDQNDLKSQKILLDQNETKSSKNSEFSLPFDPGFFGLKSGDQVEIFAKGWDRFPNREPSLSKRITIHVISLEKHAEEIRERIEYIMENTSEIAREQENILLKTKLIEEEFNSNDKKFSHKIESQMETLIENQQQNSKDLKMTAMMGIEILDDAVRNPIFDTLTLQKFAQTLNKMKQVASGSMTEASNQIKEAKNSNTSQAIQSIKKAQQAEQRAIDDLAQILSDAAQQLDRLEALTLSNRLRRLVTIEKEQSQNLIALLPQTIGQPISKMNQKIKDKKLKLVEIQDETFKEAGFIKGEISRYYERTGKPAYGQVSELMEAKKPEEKILQVVEKIQNNISFNALDRLDILIEDFQTWSTILEMGDPASEEGDGEGIRNSDSKNYTQIILSLIKIREQETEIMDKTRVLQNSNFLTEREFWTKKLKNQQDTLMIDLTDTQIEVAEEVLNPIFDDAHMAMSASSDALAKNQFSDQTLANQLKARNQVSDLINLLLENSNSKSALKNEVRKEMSGMEFLLLQMKKEDGKKPGKMTPGLSGGGSNQGGPAKTQTKGKQGKSFETSTSKRKANGSGGVSQPIPVEFKNIMENYFKAIEE